MNEAEMDFEKRVMLAEVAQQPAFVAEALTPMLASIRGAFAGRAEGPRLIYLIGCGDSLAVAIATRRYVAKHTGLSAHAVQSFEFSHYVADTLGADAAVFAISNSGSVASTLEGARRAKAAGAWTVAITANPDSKLADICETTVLVEAPQNFKTAPDGRTLVTPGTITYTASVLGALLAGLALGEARGRPIDAELGALTKLPALMGEADARTREAAKRWAPTFTGERKIVFVGGGPGFATAYFAAAKWFEGLGEPAHAAMMEEWAHQQYFFTGPDTDTVFIMPAGPSRTRALEHMGAARNMGARIIAVAAHDDADAAAAADIVFATPNGVPEDLATLVDKAPLELLSCFASQARGKT
ncbi:MAG: SIS domain-containing protein, partial [Pseudomonadota bacterium]